jgi:hypothetical protein
VFKISDTIRHAASVRGRIGLIAATGQPELRRQAEELGVAYYDDDHLKSFNKDKKRIKKWGESVTNNFIASSLDTTHPHLPGTTLKNGGIAASWWRTRTSSA